MSGLYEPIGKLSRRLGVGLTPKGARILKKRPNKPGQHGDNPRPQKKSDYGVQLIEKQKIKAFYGLRESQFKRLFDEAQRMKGPTGANLMSLLERRLDNVVYRQGLCETRRQARQLVNHGHFEVNGHQVNIPSYQVRPGEVIRIAQSSRSNHFFKVALRPEYALHYHAPEWFEQRSTDRSEWAIVRHPQREEADRSNDTDGSRKASTGELSQRLLELLDSMNDADCAEAFLLVYEKFCETELVGLPTDASSASVKNEPCPCVPRPRLSE